MELLYCRQKYDQCMKRINLNRKHIKVGDQVRLLLYTLNSPSETYYSSIFEIEGYKIFIGTEDLPHIRSIPGWSKTLEVSTDFVDSLDNCTGDIMIESEFLDITIRSKNWLEEDEVTLSNDSFKFNVTIDKENKVARGHVYAKFTITEKDYLTECKTITRSKFHIPGGNFKEYYKATYEIIKINNKGDYMGKFIEKYLSDNTMCDVQLVQQPIFLPKVLNFKYKHIYQYITKDWYWETFPSANVTDWHGRCLKPEVRELVKLGDIVRCKVKQSCDEVTYHCPGGYEDNTFRSYVHLLDQISEDRFIGEVWFQSSSWRWDDVIDDAFKYRPWEDALIEVSRDSICEITLNSEEEEKVYLTGKGYMMTGMTVM